MSIQIRGASKRTQHKISMIRVLLLIIFLLRPLSSAEEAASDGWMGQSASWTIQQTTLTSVLIVRLLLPVELGSNTVAITLDGKSLPPRTLVPGEHELRYALSGNPGTRIVALTWERTGSLPAPDSRKVSARITHIGFEAIQEIASAWNPTNDIVQANGPIGLGTGWSTIDQHQGNASRWLSQSAQIVIAQSDVDNSSRYGSLTLEAQQGYGPSGQTALVQLQDGTGKIVDKIEIGSRTHINFIVPPESLQAQPMTLVVANDNTSPAKDSNRLDLQVFKITWSP